MELAVSITGKTAGLRQGLAQSKSEINRFRSDVEKGGGLLGNLGKLGGGIGGLVGMLGNLKGLLAGGAIGVAFKHGLDFAGDLQDKADELGVSVEKLQAISDVMADAGVGPEQMEGALGKLQIKIAEALESAGPARKAFEDLGISLQDLADHAEAPDDMLVSIADGFAKSDERGRALAAVVETLGKSGRKMAGAFKEGGAPFREAMADNLKVTGQEAEAADKLGDRIAKAKRKLIDVLPGKGAGMAAQFFGKLTDPSQWKNNLFGEGNKLDAQKSKDPLEGLTPYQRDLVNKLKLDPEQARKMKPGTPVEGTQKQVGETEEQFQKRKAEGLKTKAKTPEKDKKEAHDAEMQAAQKVAELNEKTEEIRKDGAEEYFTRQQKIARISADIVKLTERMKKNDPVATAQLAQQKQQLQNQRKQLLTQSFLQTPAERLSFQRQQKREAAAGRRADRADAREIRENERRKRTGVRMRGNPDLKQPEVAGPPKPNAAETQKMEFDAALQPINTTLTNIHTELKNFKAPNLGGGAR